MPSFKYLIVGGGMTADAAVRGLRDVDKEASIGLVSAEAVPPYNRPPLTKGLWKGKPLASVWRKTEEIGSDLAARADGAAHRSERESGHG